MQPYEGPVEYGTESNRYYPEIIPQLRITAVHAPRGLCTNTGEYGHRLGQVEKNGRELQSYIMAPREAKSDILERSTPSNQ